MRPVQGVILAMVRAAKAAEPDEPPSKAVCHLVKMLEGWSAFAGIVPDEALPMYWWDLTLALRDHVSWFTDQSLEVPACVRAATRVFLDHDSWANWVTQAELPTRAQDRQPPQAYYESGQNAEGIMSENTSRVRCQHAEVGYGQDNDAG